MSKQTEIVISARCGAAAREGVNEDNCLVMKSVGKQNSKINHFGDGEYISKVFPLERNGSLLVVADGMGGMNAGEVASAIAIETISNAFKSTTIDEMELTERNIKNFMLDAIRQADEAIKKEALADPAKEGMGTTIVMLWMFKDYAYYAWCGDSRLYRYHDHRLFQLSHDHSYVCEVLGLSEAQAFDHPDNNIITRSLGSPSDTARPDLFGPLYYNQDDLFLLCSDGLCGVVRNVEIEEAMQYAVDNHDKLNLGNLNLWKIAENNHWHDNVTSLLCYVKTGEKAVEVEVKKEVPKIVVSTSSFGKEKKNNNKLYKIIALVVTIVVVASLFFFLWNFGKKHEDPGQSQVTKPAVVDKRGADPGEEFVIDEYYEPEGQGQPVPALKANRAQQSNQNIAPSSNGEVGQPAGTYTGDDYNNETSGKVPKFGGSGTIKKTSTDEEGHKMEGL